MNSENSDAYRDMVTLGNHDVEHAVSASRKVSMAVLPKTGMVLMILMK